MYQEKNECRFRQGRTEERSRMVWNDYGMACGRDYDRRNDQGGRDHRFEQDERDVYDELRYRVQHGEDLLLCGVPSYPGKIVRALFREQGSYMRDFQTDEEGYICRINFIRVE